MRKLLIISLFAILINGCNNEKEYKDDGPEFPALPSIYLQVFCKYQDAAGNNLLENKLPEPNDKCFKLAPPLSIRYNQGGEYKNIDSICINFNHPYNILLKSEIYGNNSAYEKSGIVKYAIDFSALLEEERRDTIEIHWNLTTDFTIKYDQILLNHKTAPLSKESSDIPTIFVVLK